MPIRKSIFAFLRDEFAFTYNRNSTKDATQEALVVLALATALEHRLSQNDPRKVLPKALVDRLLSWYKSQEIDFHNRVLAVESAVQYHEERGLPRSRSGDYSTAYSKAAEDLGISEGTVISKVPKKRLPRKKTGPKQR